MEHHSFDELRTLAQISSLRPAPSSSFSRRLAQWADVLDRRGGELRLFEGAEFCTRRDTLRQDGSPLSVAFADPLLRAYGLGGDTFGEGRRFFGVSNAALHKIVCYCHYASNNVVPACQVSERVRCAAARAQRRERITHIFRLAGAGARKVLVGGSY